MKVVIFGLGYVGFTAMCCIAGQGHTVAGVDISEKKVRQINEGKSPIVEPGVGDMLKKALAEGRLHASTSIDDQLHDADIAIVCVGTPTGADGAHNMGFIAEVSSQIASALRTVGARPALTVAYRSTMRPGTMDNLVRPIFEGALGETASDLVDLVYFPEFLREGSAVADYFSPPKMVFGTKDGEPNANMQALNDGIEAPTFWVRYPEAEMTKFIDNTWHALKVAFANEVGRVCMNQGISAQTAHEIFKCDTKLNISAYYTRPGGAFGGSCLPKDVRAMQHIGADTGANLHVIDSLIRSNEAHKHQLFQHAVEGLQPGARVLLAGLSFKAGTDDLRESPNVDLARKLLEWGAKLEVFEPAVEAENLVGANLGYAFSNLPTIERLLVTKTHAEAQDYDRVIAANATVNALNLPEGCDIRVIHSLA
ncbi:MAG: nucleotide sugar dehydrogenase [Pseudomonadota bacterium]